MAVTEETTGKPNSRDVIIEIVLGMVVKILTPWNGRRKLPPMEKW